MTVEQKGREKIETQGGGGTYKKPREFSIARHPSLWMLSIDASAWQWASRIIISVKSFRVALTTYWW
jgi:hypothetical protein